VSNPGLTAKLNDIVGRDIVTALSALNRVFKDLSQMKKDIDMLQTGILHIMQDLSTYEPLIQNIDMELFAAIKNKRELKS